jgi:hypothetical protein
MNDSFRSILNSVAKRLGLHERVADPTVFVRGKKPGAIGRHLIAREQLGPFYRQVGVRLVYNRSGAIVRTALVMERYFVERTLHATKGWRTRNRAFGRAVV